MPAASATAAVQSSQFHPMENEPLLSPQSQSISISSEIQHHPPPPQNQRSLRRSRTAPSLASLRHPIPQNPQFPNPQFNKSSSIIKQSILFLSLYLILGVSIYSFNSDDFSGVKTHPIVDALYFTITTICTIGYSDISPLTPSTKAFASVFVILWFGFINILLSGLVTYVLDLQESMRFPNKTHNLIRLKVGLAIGVVVLCIGIGGLGLYFVEDLDWVDSVYLAVMAVTTVGYGDWAFKTLAGRLFAVVWLLFSTLAVARAFIFLAEVRVDKMQRRVEKWLLHREFTVEDFVAADIDNNGFISKSDYVIYMLKEMGKIGEKDIEQTRNRFNKLDRNNSGRITLPDLLEKGL